MTKKQQSWTGARAEFRTDLQALRGIAILGVLLFHFDEELFSLGYLGVDIFFVLSGFVVTPLIFKIFAIDLNRTVFSRLKLFFLNRIFRLLPALCVSLFFSGVLILLFGNLSDHQKAARQGISTLLLLGNLGAYRYSGDYFSPNPNPFVHTWSLSVEEQIYIFLPIVLLFIYWQFRQLENIAFVIFLVMTILSFMLFIFPNILESTYSKFGFDDLLAINFYSTASRCWQFTIGGLGYLLLKRPKVSVNKSLKFKTVVLISLIITLFVILNPNQLIVSSVIITIITLAGILLRTLDSLPCTLSKILLWLGDRSYSIYLFHMPLLYVAKYSLIFDSSSKDRYFLSAVAVILSLALGSVSYTHIENRYRMPHLQRISRSQILFTILSFFLLPTFLFLAIDQGSLNRYWGLDRTLERPLYAGDLDKNCVRQNDKPDSEPCIYGSILAEKTILLVGDSHATHFSQALIDSVDTSVWKVAIWAHGHCPIQFNSALRDDVTPKCLAQNIKMLKWVGANKPSSIVVSQFVKQDSDQLELRSGLNLLKMNSDNLLLILNTPVFPDVNNFMVSRPLTMKPYSPPKGFPIQSMVKTHMIASASLGQWARNNGITTLDFSPLFCSQLSCSRYASGNWLYWDDDHLSIYGASLAQPSFRNYFLSLSKESLRSQN